VGLVGEPCPVGCVSFSIFQLDCPLLHRALPSFPPPAMSAPTNVAAPPLPVGEKPIAKPKKQPYPFWLGGN